MSVKRSATIRTAATPEDWAGAREKARRALASMSPEEDAAITAAALSDPDNPPLADDAVLVSWTESEARRSGRLPVLIDGEIVDRFRRTGEGWEERLNDALRTLTPAE